jgi:hypothetical protein
MALANPYPVIQALYHTRRRRICRNLLEPKGWCERFSRAEQLERRVQMLLGIFSSHGVLPLEFKPAYWVGHLLLQRLGALEQEAEEKGGVQQVLADHFAKVYMGMVLKQAA